jgi:hypothetical protein
LQKRLIWFSKAGADGVGFARVPFKNMVLTTRHFTKQVTTPNPTLLAVEIRLLLDKSRGLHYRKEKETRTTKAGASF